MEWYLAVLKNYAGFSGRARRKEFWFFALFNFLISFGLGIIDGILGLGGDSGIGILGLLYSLAVFIPGLAVSIRRLHDTGRSGWWLLISLVPIVGFFVLLFFFIGDSDGPNQYDT